ncbi:MAG: GTP 3',8-cyclase MoaA, partial [Acidiferrobacteraceae bacterium]
PFGRRIEYVRVSVTDRCDLRCTYCLPKGFSEFDEPEDWLTFDEIERILRVFVRLGVKRLRITGGEPLVRRNVADLAQRLARLGIGDLSLSTNGVRLGRLAGSLRQAGVTRLNVSLDSLRPDRFAAITGGGRLHKVLDGLMAAKAAGFSPIKINTVAMKGVNDDEFDAFVGFCIEHSFTWRLIETMPIGDTGREAQRQYLDLQTVRARLAERYTLLPVVIPGGGPARYVRVDGTSLVIGFITPISQHFCATCNRVRLSVDGRLYLCLGQENSVDLRSLARSGGSEDELMHAIVSAIGLKPERHEFQESPHKIMRFMARTGG